MEFEEVNAAERDLPPNSQDEVNDSSRIGQTTTGNFETSDRGGRGHVE
jgi:hypothetical protein